MTAEEKAERIVRKEMYEKDAFSQWLGIQLIDVRPGTCTLEMEVRPEMTNGFSIAHGGITYSFSDSALAFASNGHGIRAVSIDTSISHLRPVLAGDVLRAIAEEKHLSPKLGVYEIKVWNQRGELVALFKGTVYRTGKSWLEPGS